MTMKIIYKRRGYEHYEQNKEYEMLGPGLWEESQVIEWYQLLYFLSGFKAWKVFKEFGISGYPISQDFKHCEQDPLPQKREGSGDQW